MTCIGRMRPPGRCPGQAETGTPSRACAECGQGWGAQSGPEWQRGMSSGWSEMGKGPQVWIRVIRNEWEVDKRRLNGGS